MDIIHHRGADSARATLLPGPGNVRRANSQFTNSQFGGLKLKIPPDLGPAGIIENENSHSADYFKHLHDLRMVWTPEIQGQAPLDRDPCQLGDRLFRIRVSSPGESNWLE